MAEDPRSSYASYRPDLSEARLLSIAHQKAVQLHAAQQTAYADPPQVGSTSPPAVLVLSLTYVMLPTLPP